MKSIKKTIEFKKTEWKSVTRKIKKEITFPLFWIDKYGYTEASFDGKTTVSLGMNGVQCEKKGTHSIETHDFLSDDILDKETRVITKDEFKKELRIVGEYVQSLIKKLT